MNWLFVVLSFFMPLVQQQVHYVQQQRYQQQQAPQRPLYQVNGRWYTYANGEWYVWTDNGWVFNLPQGATR